MIWTKFNLILFNLFLSVIGINASTSSKKPSNSPTQSPSASFNSRLRLAARRYAGEFDQYKEKFNLTFNCSHHHDTVLLTYAANRLYINKENRKENHTYTLGITKFTHLTPSEFIKSNHFFGRNKNKVPTTYPTIKPSKPSVRPSTRPTGPTRRPSTRPTKPTVRSSTRPTKLSTRRPSRRPSVSPTKKVASSSSIKPSSKSTKTPSALQTVKALASSNKPSFKNTKVPSTSPFIYDTSYAPDATYAPYASYAPDATYAPYQYDDSIQIPGFPVFRKATDTPPTNYYATYSPANYNYPPYIYYTSTAQPIKPIATTKPVSTRKPSIKPTTGKPVIKNPTPKPSVKSTSKFKPTNRPSTRPTTIKPTIKAASTKPSFKPTSAKPSLKSNQPTIKPNQPSLRPINPTFKPNNPTFKPINPTFQPINPTFKPINPTLKPIPPSPMPILPQNPTIKPVNNGPLTSTTVDWTQPVPYVGYTGPLKGPFLNPVQDQGQCGSCWAFSAVAVLENAYYLKYGALYKFSEQHVVSCDTTNGAGCDGGFEDNVPNWVKAVGGIPLASVYPYTDGATGRTSACKTGYPLTPFPISFVNAVLDNSASAASIAYMKSALNLSPVMVAIDASSTVFQNYVSGVITSAACGTELNHAVVAVGYGVENGIEYVKVRNSWTADWGEEGHVKIAFTACGVTFDWAQIVWY